MMLLLVGIQTILHSEESATPPTIPATTTPAAAPAQPVTTHTTEESHVTQAPTTPVAALTQKQPEPTHTPTPQNPDRSAALPEKTTQELVTGMTQLTQTIQLLIHVIQQAQSAGAPPENKQTTPQNTTPSKIVVA